MTKCTHCGATVLSTSQTASGWDDPADVWEAYCAETPTKRRSPQGALAFGFHAALAAEPDEASWRSGATPAAEEAGDNLRLIDYIADRIGLPDTDELSRENFDAWMSATPAVGGERLPLVERIEMVQSPNGYEIPADPMWRVVVSGICADFETETAANNLRNAIFALAQPAFPLRAAAERVCWFDWSDNDMDVVAAIDALRKAVTSSASPPEQPATTATVKIFVDAIDAKNARIAQLEEALGKAVLSEQRAAVPAERLACRRCGGWGTIRLGNGDRVACDRCNGTTVDPDQSPAAASENKDSSQ